MDLISLSYFCLNVTDIILKYCIRRRELHVHQNILIRMQIFRYFQILSTNYVLLCVPSLIKISPFDHTLGITIQIKTPHVDFAGLMGFCLAPIGSIIHT